MTKKNSNRRDEILAYLEKEALQFHLPTVREIALQCNITSTASVLAALNNLVAEGRLLKVKGRKYIPSNMQVAKKHPL